jgi:hypothetical protein
MSSRDQKIKHLGDHLPYELLMLRHAYRQMLVDRYALDWNAFYEAFVVHARILFEFLMNEGGPNNFKARDFSSEFIAKKCDTVQRLINQHLHWQVFHFGKQRKSDDEDKVGNEERRAIFDWIEENFTTFIAALEPELRAHWRPEHADLEKVRAEFTKVRDTIPAGLPRQSASTGKPQSFPDPTRA